MIVLYCTGRLALKYPTTHTLRSRGTLARLSLCSHPPPHPHHHLHTDARFSSQDETPDTRQRCRPNLIMTDYISLMTSRVQSKVDDFAQPNLKNQTLDFKPDKYSSKGVGASARIAPANQPGYSGHRPGCMVSARGHVSLHGERERERERERRRERERERERASRHAFAMHLSLSLRLSFSPSSTSRT